ncbi:MAG TPA: hypothetical protein VEC60_05240 [Reyranella sp.]|nr:hypothetical protein [Reyranella sp.]
MRYLHYDAARLCEYISVSGLLVAQCDFESKAPPNAVDVSAIQTMLKRSETLWGTALPYYLWISKSAEGNTASLAEAVAQIESSADQEKFLIVAYQDGGLISVSGIRLPFQVDARKADWWGPYKSASRSSR